MSEILSLASEYLDCKIIKVSSNVYGLDFADGSFSSLRIFSDTDSAYHYSENRYYTPETFARYIVGLSGEELEELLPEIKLNQFLSLLNNIADGKQNTGLSLQDVVAQPGYNDYLKNTRNLSEETIKHYGIELNSEGDVYIPLHDIQNFNRVGTQVRSASSNDKYSRYRTHMAGSHVKPLCWPGWSLKDVKPDTVFVVVEGIFSVMRLQQVCLHKTSNVIPIATLTNHVDEQLIDLLHEHVLILIPDSDEGGTAMSDKFKEICQQKGYSNYEIYRPYDEHNNGQFLDEMTDDELRGFFNSIYQQTKFNFKIRR